MTSSTIASNAFTLLLSLACGACGGADVKGDPLPSASSSAVASLAGTASNVAASSSAPTPSASACVDAAVPDVGPEEVTTGYRISAKEPRAERSDLSAEAALVWRVSPPEKDSKDHALIVTELVVRDGDGAKVVDQRNEAVFSSAKSLWHLSERKLPSRTPDCSDSDNMGPVAPPHAITLHETVLESLDKKKRTISPMHEHLKAGEWARMDIESMAGPYVTVTVDHYSAGCGGRPIGSAYRALIDLDAGAQFQFKTGAPGFDDLQNRANDAFARACENSKIELGDKKITGLYYDERGDLKSEVDFFQFVSSACFHGTEHAFVSTFRIPKEVEPYGRLPLWLRKWLVTAPSMSIAPIPLGREKSATEEFSHLPLKAKALPNDSGPDD